MVRALAVAPHTCASQRRGARGCPTGSGHVGRAWAWLWREKHPTYPKEWRAKHPSYDKDRYVARKAQLKKELSVSECAALDAAEDSDGTTSASEDGYMELVYDSNAWFNEICDKGFTVSFE